jgi:hypothetical protein
MGDDKPFPPAYEVVDELAAKKGNIPISVSIPYDIFTDRLSKKTLPGNIIYFVWGVPDTETGNRLMDEVKNYRI